MGGTLVTITGTDLAGAMAVVFGSTAVTSFLSDSPTSIIVSSPAGTGAVHITVVTSAGTSAASSDDQFSYVASQEIATSLSGIGGSGAFGATASLMATLTAGASLLAGRTVTFSLDEHGLGYDPRRGNDRRERHRNHDRREPGRCSLPAPIPTRCVPSSPAIRPTPVATPPAPWSSARQRRRCQRPSRKSPAPELGRDSHADGHSDSGCLTASRPDRHLQP